MKVRQLILFLFFATATLQVTAEELTVAVASNFTAAMKDITAEFEKASGHKVKLAFGSSGKLYAQIKNGAPFQVFFSADRAKPAALARDGLAVPGSRFTYAVGSLALWSAAPDLVDGQASVLKAGRFRKLALANPKLAPYGQAAVEALRNLGLEEATRAKWVRGENIAQAYQFVATGNADLGFVALSQIVQKGRVKKGSAWVVPLDLYSPIRQDALLLRRGAKNNGAVEFLQFARGAKARAIIESYGYRFPAEKSY